MISYVKYVTITNEGYPNGKVDVKSFEGKILFSVFYGETIGSVYTIKIYRFIANNSILLVILP
jgi:hypothetical protein